MEERRDKNRAGDWQDWEGSVASCADCGVEDAVGNLYHTGSGLSCAVCFASNEDEISVKPPASVWRLFLRGMPFLLMPLPMVAHQLDWMNLDAHVFGVQSVFVVVWGAFVIGSLMLSPFALVAIAALAREDYFRPSLDVGARGRLMVGHGWLATALVAGLVATCVTAGC